MKKLILAILLFLSTPCFADDVSGLVDTCLVSGAGVLIQIAGDSYQSDNDFLNDSIIYAFRHNQELSVSYHVQGADRIIDSVYVNQPGEYYSKIISLFIGSVSAGAFALGLGVRIS